MAHDAKPGERDLPEPDGDLTDEEATVTLPDDGDVHTASDADLNGDDYDEPLEETDDEAVAEANDAWSES